MSLAALFWKAFYTYTLQHLDMVAAIIAVTGILLYLLGEGIRLYFRTAEKNGVSVSFRYRPFVLGSMIAGCVWLLVAVVLYWFLGAYEPFFNLFR